MARLRGDENGSALITALLAAVMMLALGLGLLAIVDTQTSESGKERIRDRGFNLAEGVLTQEAFVLGRNWPDAMPVGNPSCSAAGAGFSDALGSTTATSAATARLRPNINASYTDAAYSGATWQVNICDDTSLSTVWTNAALANASWDANANQKIWVRTQATVSGETRAVVGLVNVRQTPALRSKYGLVAGNVSEDLGPATSVITNNSVVTALSGGLLNSNPPVAQDPAYPLPDSGVTGLRCGLLDNLALTKSCITGAIGALSQVPLINTLVTQGRFEQYPSVSSTSATTIAQLRSQSKTSPGVYMATAPGGSTPATAPSCGISGATTGSVVFVEQVGSGDQWCVLNVSTSVTYKALVIGSGRVIIRGSNSITPYSTAATNRFTGVVYALNLQTADQTLSAPVRELVRVEQGARVTGAIHADGKNATVGLIAPDFDATALINGLLCPGALCALAPAVTGLLGTLGLSGTIDALVNGTCLVRVLGICTVSLPPLGVTGVVNGITAQFSTYGSAVHNDVGVVNNLKVHGASGVVPGTFRDLYPR